MPNESANLYISIQSGNSERTLTSLADKTKALDKETQLLQQATEGLARANKPLLEQQTKLQSELKDAQKTVNELRKAYDEYGDEMMGLDLDQAVENHARLKQELAEVNAQLGANQKTYKEYLETVRKGGLQESGGASLSTGNGGGSGTSLGGILGGLGIGNMLTGMVENFADFQLSSALGSSMGSAVSGTLSSTLSGAALGTAIAPGIGTAIGAALGAISGAINAATEIAEEKDDAFIEYYNGLVDTYGGLRAGNTESGSAIASGREDDLRVLRVLLGDNAAHTLRFQQSLVELGRTPPFSYDTVSALSKDMLGLGLSPDDALDRINSLAEAAAALDWSEGSVSTVISNLESAQLAGKMDSRVVKSLSKMGVNVYGALAEEFNISEDEVMDKLGDLDVDRAVDAIYTYLGERFAGAAAGLADTYSGASGILESYRDDIAAAAGEGYNTLRTEGINEEILALGGELGDAMKEINTIIGENQARGENLKDEYMREAISSVLLGESSGLFDEKNQAKLDEMAAEYAEAAEAYENGSAEAGLKMQSLYEQAQAMGAALYESSEWAQTEIDVQKEQIEAIRNNTAGLAAAAAAFLIAQERSKGGGAVQMSARYPKMSDEWREAATEAYPGMADDDLDELYQIWYDTGGAYGGIYVGSESGYAYGLDRVPYDDYPALLHEGERVLTASEARAMDAGGGAVVQITVSGNNFVGTGEEMADQIAEILARKLEGAATIAVPR